MLLNDALNFIIDDGIEAARADYTRPAQRQKLEGAIRGFEDCRGKSPVEIARLLRDADERTQEAYRAKAADYWYWRCRAAEIEWVANVVSAILMNQGLPTIVTPTARGVMKAAEIVGTETPTPRR